MGFNPAAFVTPYTAVGTSRIGSGMALGQLGMQKAQQDISKGYLGLQNRQQDFAEKKYANEEVDQAHKALLSAIAAGDPDAVEAAANNMRAVGSRYGLTIDEVRSGRAPAGMAGEQGTASDALDSLDSSGEAPEAPLSSPEQAETDLIAGKGDFAAEPERSAFTGMRPPGGALPPAASAAEPAGTSEAPLRGYTIRGPDGKALYSVSPKDVVQGQRERVSAIFEGLRSRLGSQADVGGLDEAERIAHGLVGVLTPQQAALKGLEHFENQQAMRGKIEMMEANRRPRGGGGGGIGGLLGKNEDRAESTDKYGDNIEMALQHRGIPAAEQSLAQAEGALMSGDPALQKDALKIILKARSGLTVSEAERRSYSMVDGAIPALRNAVAQWTGEPLDEQTVQSYLAIIRNMHQANQETARGIVAYEQNKYKAQNRRKVADDVLEERAQSLDPNAPSKPDAKGPKKKKAKDLY